MWNKLKKKNNIDYKKSYAQCGEDILIEYIFMLRGIKNPSYIDIGAHHPFYLSNTALFYEKGSRGINIEANPDLLNAFLKERPNDTNLNIGVGTKEGELDFYVMEDTTLSTFSLEESKHLQQQGKKLNYIKKISTISLPKIIEKFANNIFPDFLSLDVEGLDFEILQTIDFKHNFPKVICVEAAEYSPIGAGNRRTELIDFLVGNDYYEYANTNLNAIMVKKDFWFV